MTLRSTTTLALALLGASCGARFQALDPLDPTTEPELEHGLRFTDRTHGHRDYPRAFDAVWDATVEGLHAGGIPVPASARPEGSPGRIEVERVLVEVDERRPGRTCVRVRFRGLDEESGRREARVLLDAIQRRLR